jgi:hypothetical protein
MQSANRLALAVALALLLAATIVAGETSSPPCVPGDVSTPPCASITASSSSTAPGEVSTPPAAESFDALALTETLLALVF